MISSIHITGQAPERYETALAELKGELGFGLCEKGVSVTAVKGDHLGVFCDGESVTVTWAEPIQFYRALSLIPLDLAKCDIHEEPAFQTTGVMFDCSRNAVINPDALKMFLRKMDKCPDNLKAINEALFANVVKPLSAKMGVDAEQFEKRCIKLWVYTHGVASLVAMGLIDMNEDTVTDMLREAEKNYALA